MTLRRARPPIEPRLLSPEQAATYCGVSVGMFRERIPVLPIAFGRRRLYDRRDLDQFIDSLKQGAPASGEDWLGRFDENAA